jgi:hypothetical protein
VSSDVSKELTRLVPHNVALKYALSIGRENTKYAIISGSDSSPSTFAKRVELKRRSHGSAHRQARSPCKWPIDTDCKRKRLALADQSTPADVNGPLLSYNSSNWDQIVSAFRYTPAFVQEEDSS